MYLFFEILSAQEREREREREREKERRKKEKGRGERGKSVTLHVTIGSWISRFSFILLLKNTRVFSFLFPCFSSMQISSRREANPNH